MTINKMKLKVLAMVLMICCYSTQIVLANGECGLDGAPAQVGDGEFVADSEMLELIQEKENTVAEYMERLNARSNYTNTVTSITQYPQETGNWCGYASLKMILASRGISIQQSSIVSEIGNVTGYSWYDFNNEGCPWLMVSGSAVSDFPAAVYLNSKLGYMEYAPYPYGAAGGTAITEADIRARIMYDIDNGHGVMVCGISQASGNSHINGYPQTSVGHWIVVRGYTGNGNIIRIADPVAASVVSWGGNINAYYELPIANLTAFAQPKGIIY